MYIARTNFAKNKEYNITLRNEYYKNEIFTYLVLHLRYKFEQHKCLFNVWLYIFHIYIYIYIR